MNPTLQETIVSRQQAYRDLLVELGRLESPSHHKAGVDAVGRLLASFSQDLGFGVHTRPFEQAGDGLLITLNPQAEKSPVTLIAHTDTVHEVGAFGDPPVRLDQDQLTGPGVYDCKGGIAVALLAMEALQAAAYTDRPVQLLLVPDEEVSSSLSGPAGIAFIRDTVRGSLFACCCESGHADGSVAVGRKGILKLAVTVTGRAAHAGSNYHLGASAIRAAASQILALETADIAAGVTINCGVISGGDKPNIVPDHCRYLLDIRFRTVAEKEADLAVVGQLLQTPAVPGTHTRFELLSERIPMERTAGNDALLAFLNQQADRLGLAPFKAFEAGGGADSAYAVAEGVPTVCSLGIVGQEQHTTRERADLASLADRALVLAAAIYDSDRFA